MHLKNYFNNYIIIKLLKYSFCL